MVTAINDGAKTFIPWDDFTPDYNKPTLDQSSISEIGIKCIFRKAGAFTTTLTISYLSFGGTTGTIIDASAAQSVKFALTGKSLAFKTATALNVEVFDLQGRLVANGAVSKANSALNLNSLSQGSYLVRATGADVNLMQKIIIAD